MIEMGANGIKEAMAEFKAIQDRTNHGSPYFQRAAMVMHREAIEHFQKQEGPAGTESSPGVFKSTKPWVPTKFYEENGGPDVRRARPSGRRGGTKILMDTGILRGSILFQGHENDARVYTETTYAATHQYGDPSRNIPARPFLWLKAETVETLRENYIPWLLGGVVK